MTPEYIEHLANLADPDEFWRRNPIAELTLEQSRQRDTGVALRRHAAHLRRLNSLLGTGKALCLTPLSLNGVFTKIVPAPADDSINPPD